ncbi:hypothetical protein GCM10010234_44010 [Streptomyces hawaiiensis]
MSAVAEAPAKAYNPLFISGESGLGKTHLLHAIGHYTRSLYPGTRVRYVTSEEFTNEFINSIRDGKGDSFRKRYREMDILLVDDTFNSHVPVPELTDPSLPKFGGRDHTTVRHTDSKIRALTAERRSIYS